MTFHLAVNQLNNIVKYENKITHILLVFKRECIPIACFSCFVSSQFSVSICLLWVLHKIMLLFFRYVLFFLYPNPRVLTFPTVCIIWNRSVHTIKQGRKYKSTFHPSIMHLFQVVHHKIVRIPLRAITWSACQIEKFLTALKSNVNWHQNLEI